MSVLGLCGSPVSADAILGDIITLKWHWMLYVGKQGHNIEQKIAWHACVVQKVVEILKETIKNIKQKKTYEN